MTDTESTASSDGLDGDHRRRLQRLGRWRRFWRNYTNMFSIARASLFWALLRRQKRTMIWLLAMTVFYSVGLLQIANLTRGMVDNAIVDQVAPLWQYVRYITFWAIWGLVFGFIVQQLAERLTYSIEFDLRMWLYTHIQSGDLRRLDTVATGQLVTRSLTDVELIVTLLRILPTLIGFVPVLIAVAVIVIIINPIMGVMAVLALPINAWLIGRFRARLRALSWAELNERAEVTERDRRAGARHPCREGLRARGHRTQQGRQRHRAGVPLLDDPHPTPRPLRPVHEDDPDLRAGGRARGRGLPAGVRSHVGRHVPARLPVEQRAEHVRQHLRPVRQRLAVPPRRPGSCRRDARVQLASRHRRPNGARPVDRTRTARHLRHVRRPAVCWEASMPTSGRGELVVVHGAPGSGKSTLAGIASGLIVPTVGTTILDGVPLADLDPTQLRRTIRVVSEEPLLLATSLRDNLLLGAFGDIDDEQLTDAIRAAGVDEIIEELGGLDGVLGDRGSDGVRRAAPTDLAGTSARRPTEGAAARRRAVGGEPVARDRDHEAGPRGSSRKRRSCTSRVARGSAPSPTDLC